MKEKLWIIGHVGRHLKVAASQGEWEMCRSIKSLRISDGPAVSEDEIREAALQFVRKISGYRVPSQRNREAFDQAVQEIAHVSSTLLESLTPSSASAATR